jgi:mono/diheme cytochrome c family protein
MKRLTASTLLFACIFFSAGASAAETPDGAKLFADHCAACHGSGAEGDGPVASVMTLSVPNLRTLAMRNGGTFPSESVRAYIDGRQMKPAHGDRQMPVWGDVFRGPEQGTAERTVRRRIAALVDFIAGIQYR